MAEDTELTWVKVESLDAPVLEIFSQGYAIVCDWRAGAASVSSSCSQSMHEMSPTMCLLTASDDVVFAGGIETE